MDESVADFGQELYDKLKSGKALNFGGYVDSRNNMEISVRIRMDKVGMPRSAFIQSEEYISDLPHIIENLQAIQAAREKDE